MNINNINSNINILNSPSGTSQLERPLSSQDVSKIYENSLSLSLNDYNLSRDKLSIDIRAINDGIAISNISKDSIYQQKEILANIQNTLESSKIFDDKNSIKNNILDDLRAFNTISNTTKFKNENLLQANEEQSSSLYINTQDKTFYIEKPNSADISNNISEYINTLDLNDNTNLNATIYQVNEAYKRLDNSYKDLAKLNNNLLENAKSNLESQNSLHKNMKHKKDIDFANESINFSKTNVISNSGYLAATQANIRQDQTIRLLS